MTTNFESVFRFADIGSVRDANSLSRKKITESDMNLLALIELIVIFIPPVRR